MLATVDASYFPGGPSPTPRGYEQVQSDKLKFLKKKTQVFFLNNFQVYNELPGSRTIIPSPPNINPNRFGTVPTVPATFVALTSPQLSFISSMM